RPPRSPYGNRGGRSLGRLAEGLAAGAATGGVGVVDREALLLDRVDEVDRRTQQVGVAHAVDDDVDPAEVGDDVTVERAVVEEQLVAKAGAAAGLHSHAQREVGA